MPMTFGTTSSTAPETPDFAGRPTLGKQMVMRKQKLESALSEFFLVNLHDQSTLNKSKGAHMKGELSGKVIHATGVHETQGVAHSFSTQYTITCDWTNPPIGKRGSHDTS